MLVLGMTALAPSANVTSSTRTSLSVGILARSDGSADTSPIFPKSGSRMILTESPSRIPVRWKSVGTSADARRAGNDDLRTNHPGPDLCRAGDRGFLSCVGRQQPKGLGGHWDRSKSLGENQRKAHLLGAGDRHPKVIAQECAQILIMNPADNQARDAEFFGLGHRLCRKKGASDHDLSLHRPVSDAPVPAVRPATPPPPSTRPRPLRRCRKCPAPSCRRLPPRRLDARDRLDNCAVDIGQQIEHTRRFPQQHLSGHFGQRFDRSRDRRADLRF